ncbi:MAG: sulfate adenylyltransferase, partial [Bacteroidota bacterium]|nr:sulfate adenylyltransferase [Bacteroidota bacterium]
NRGKYTLKHTSKEARCMIKDIQYKVDINTLHRLEDDKEIKCNDIAKVTLRVTQPLFADQYKDNRSTGSVIIIDEATNNTVGAGMIV